MTLQYTPGLVSVILVNFRGADDTVVALERLRQVDWPLEALEVVVVENGSADDSASKIRAAAPWAVLVESPANLGFAGGSNLGAARAKGEYLAFLNNDARPDAKWISAAVSAFASSEGIGAVASKVLDWDGRLVDFVGAGLTWFGMGYKPLVGAKPDKHSDQARDVLFGTGSAMFVRRSVFEELGGFDKEFFMFFEDVDLGWRLNLLGWRFRYVPESIAYHRHHGAAGKFGEYRETYFLERNALATLYKNLDAESLDRVLAPAIALVVRRSIAKGEIDSGTFDYRADDDDRRQSMQVSKSVLAGIFGIDQYIEMLPHLVAAREKVQSTRRVSDRKLRPLFGRLDVPAFGGRQYLDGYDSLTNAFDVLEEPRATRVLIVTGDPLGAQVAGPAIRAWNMADQLAAENEVTLVTLSSLEPQDAPFSLAAVRPGDDHAFRRFESWADVIVFQGHAIALFPSLRKTRKIVVADVYDPIHLEQLEQGRELPRGAWDRQVSDATAVLNEQLERADFLLCASERQRHFFLGQLAALGRINPESYLADNDLRKLIDVAPFGLSRTPPVHTRDALRGVAPGIGSNDKLLLWGGGLYNWFDPHTLIRAVAELSETRSDVRLFFQGTKHPNPHVPEMRIVAESRALAADLGVLDSAVFFNEAWVAFDDRQNYLLEADAGVSTHHAHIETTFSFRTRILDYLWAGLPMVVTEGDSFADLVEAEGLGIVVPPQDVRALTAALEKALYDKEFIAQCRANVERVRQSFYWDRALAPLVEFMRSPSRAADRFGTNPERAAGGSRRTGKSYGFGRDFQLALLHLRESGLRAVIGKVARRLRSRFGR
ncbi:glycosyltransferase [Microbacterium sp. STN6]|uniref:glycosyltransferase n=1 Tax=Microbacterium sp. STN6 TaxID=2995588 RepID=UPI002260F053|nr:glycosyltransferase [Microbacterium sp. STN6]MCX7521030.1 glycosyltransferase [Microbacterium sp. STN6]